MLLEESVDLASLSGSDRVFQFLLAFFLMLSLPFVFRFYDAFVLTSGVELLTVLVEVGLRLGIV